MKPRPGPKKGCTAKNRDPVIEAIEVKLKAWVVERAGSGLLVTNALLFSKYIYFFFWPGEIKNLNF
jgi:hypothetical protein